MVRHEQVMNVFRREQEAIIFCCHPKKKVSHLTFSCNFT